jgi:hypothetical protein
MTQEQPLKTKLGAVISGSLAKGLDVRLDGASSVEDMAVGRYVTIEGQRQRFFGMITDISLGMANPELAVLPFDTEDPFVGEVLAGTSTYGLLHVLPLVTLSGPDAVLDGAQPVKTVPSHFSPVNQAAQADVERVFGPEDDSRFYVGTPLDMETRICLNLEEFAKRSNGIFGKSGTGKTYLTRLLLIGLLQKSRAVNLIFDMHGEYGWSGKSESRREVKGLKPLFPSQVAIFALDEVKARLAPHRYDATVKIGYDEIEPEDIALLRQTLNLTEPAVEAAYQLAHRFRRQWIQSSLDLTDREETKDLLEELHIHESTFQNLLRGLAAIRRLPFLVPHAPENTVTLS